jgi:hypothetical protein
MHVLFGHFASFGNLKLNGLWLGADLEHTQQRHVFKRDWIISLYSVIGDFFMIFETT